MTTVAERVERLALENGVSIDETDRACRLAREFSRIEGIEGDRTLDLIAALALRGVISKEEAYRLSIEHGDELDGSSRNIDVKGP